MLWRESLHCRIFRIALKGKKRQGQFSDPAYESKKGLGRRTEDFLGPSGRTSGDKEQSISVLILMGDWCGIV